MGSLQKLILSGTTALLVCQLCYYMFPPFTLCFLYDFFPLELPSPPPHLLTSQLHPCTWNLPTSSSTHWYWQCGVHSQLQPHSSERLSPVYPQAHWGEGSGGKGNHCSRPVQHTNQHVLTGCHHGCHCRTVAGQGTWQVRSHNQTNPLSSLLCALSTHAPDITSHWSNQPVCWEIKGRFTEIRAKHTFSLTANGIYYRQLWFYLPKVLRYLRFLPLPPV